MPTPAAIAGRAPSTAAVRSTSAVSSPGVSVKRPAASEKARSASSGVMVDVLSGRVPARGRPDPG